MGNLPRARRLPDAHGDICHANHPACPANASEATHTAPECTCACDEGYRDADPDDGQLVCTKVLPVCLTGDKTDECRRADGEHVHGPPDSLNTEFGSFTASNCSLAHTMSGRLVASLSARGA